MKRNNAHVEIPQGCLRALHITLAHTLKVTLPSGLYAVKKILLVYANVNMHNYVICTGEVTQLVKHFHLSMRT